MMPTESVENSYVHRPDDAPPSPRPLRLWPGILIVVVVWLGRFVLPHFVPEATVYGVFGGLLGSLAVLCWWVTFSRAPARERLAAVILVIAALLITPTLLHRSMAEGGMGLMFYFFVAPVLSAALVVWAVATRRRRGHARLVTMALAIAAACGVWTLVRTDGVTGDFDHDFRWRWAASAEQRLLEQPDTPETPSRSGPTPAERSTSWTGFRGERRDGTVPNTIIGTDWTTAPPVERWRRTVGPGWSSCAVVGDRFYTQEQRGDAELVACYRLSDGAPLWQHRNTARFWESLGGPGPRATPTVHGGRVYALGATGILNALNAETGEVTWSRSAATDAGRETPYWGFAGSPLVVGEMLLVSADGALIAYDLETGRPRWQRATSPNRHSYSSPQRISIAGTEQVVLLTGEGAVAVAPADGALLWEHAWPGEPIVQPAALPGGDLLISAAQRSGVRRLAVLTEDDAWRVKTRWTSTRLKPYYNDFVVHHHHAYGFDGSRLACIDLTEGQRRWKGGRYGHGQLLLLPSQNLLLVLSEQGVLALVKAGPDGFEEIARYAALEGKTWNHPVLVGDLLLVRNDREMAAFTLPTP